MEGRFLARPGIAVAEKEDNVVEKREERPADPYEKEPVDRDEQQRLERYMRPGAAPLSQFGVSESDNAVSWVSLTTQKRTLQTRSCSSG